MRLRDRPALLVAVGAAAATALAVVFFWLLDREDARERQRLAERIEVLTTELTRLGVDVDQIPDSTPSPPPAPPSPTSPAVIFEAPDPSPSPATTTAPNPEPPPEPQPDPAPPRDEPQPPPDDPDPLPCTLLGLFCQE